jgi:hypothetical protein
MYGLFDKYIDTSDKPYLMLTYKRTAKLTGEQGVVSKLQGILW